ncbi:MAG: tetratricopeptide repeat protein [Gloeotrichia echinulata GP01]
MVKFVGREKELGKLDELLQRNQQTVTERSRSTVTERSRSTVTERSRSTVTERSRSNPFLIAGMGGVGKTELALQYAISRRETYKGGICWLLAKAGDVGVQILQFARTYLDLNPPDDFDLLAKLQYCYQRWREGEVLLIVDDVSDYQEVKPYLQSITSRFKVLITSRHALGRIPQLSLNVLQPEAALELLTAIIGEERIALENHLNPQVALQLCEWLGYLPLGLELVGRYLARKQDLSLAEMRRRLEKKRLEQPALDKAESDMTAERGVLAAFELSWQELQEADKQLGYLLSVFAPAPIPWKLVELCLPNEDAEEIEDIRDEKLLNLHLLQRQDEGVYKLHPLLREFFQYKLKGLDVGEKFQVSVCGVMVAVAKDIPDTPTLEQIKAVSLAIPHIAEVANNLIEYLSDDDLPWPFVGNAWFYNGQGLYNQAEPWYEQCLEITKKRLSDEHPHVASSLNNLALLYYSQGRYSEAEPLYLKALELRRRLLGDEHPDVASSLNNLAGLYRNQGRYSEAEPLLREALELRQRLLGDEHADVALSLNNLALLYDSQGRYNEAEPLYLKALELTRRLLGDEHPDVALSLNNLAELYRNQGRYSEAEPLLLEALELWRRLLGDEHPHVASSLNNLAALYNSQGRYREAEPLYLEALELMRRLLGDEHPDVALSLNNLAELYRNQGRYREAEPLYLEALELMRRLLGDEHPDVALSLNNLAYLYYSQGRYSEAEPLYLQALAIFEQHLGVNHPNTITVRENLADCQASLTKISEEPESE